MCEPFLLWAKSNEFYLATCFNAWNNNKCTFDNNYYSNIGQPYNAITYSLSQKKWLNELKKERKKRTNEGTNEWRAQNVR